MGGVPCAVMKALCTLCFCDNEILAFLLVCDLFSISLSLPAEFLGNPKKNMLNMLIFLPQIEPT